MPYSPGSSISTFELQGDFDRLSVQNDEMQRTIEELKKSQRDTIADYERMKSDRNSCRQQASQVTKLQTELDALSSQMNLLKWELERESVGWMTEKNEYNAQLNELTRQLEKNKALLHEFEEQDKFRTKEIARLQSELEKDRQREREKEAARAQERLQARQERDKELEQEKQRERERQAEVQHYTDKMLQMDADRAEWDSQLAKMEREREHMRELEAQLVADREKMRQDRIRERQEMEKEQAIRREKIDELKDKMAKTREEADQLLKQEIADIQVTRDKEMKALNNEISSLEAEAQRLRDELARETKLRQQEEELRKREIKTAISDAIFRLTQHKLYRTYYTKWAVFSKERARKRKMLRLQKELNALATEFE